MYKQKQSGNEKNYFWINITEKEVVKVCCELFKQLQIQITAKSKTRSCLSGRSVCPATAQTAPGSGAAAQGGLRCLEEILGDATVHGAEYAPLCLTDGGYMF